MDRPAWGRVALYLVVTFAADWVLAYAAYAAGIRWGTPRSVALGTVYMLIPGLVAAAFAAARRESIATALGLRPEFNAAVPLAIIFGAALCVGASALTLLMPGVQYAPDASGVLDKAAATLTPEQLQKLRDNFQKTSPPVMYLFGLLQAVTAGATVNAIVSMGEEAGWRGWLGKELAPLGFWKQSLFVGVVWGLWHAPLVLQGHNYPDHPELGVGLMVVFTVLLSPPLAWLRRESGTTWAPALAHGVINGGAGLSLLLVRGGDDLVIGLPGLPGMLCLVAANVLIYRHGDKLSGRT
ncbi:MAG: CPBP family intramembrane metalloprotease [Deltaproteobacteria bacterium]|nr:CPBP family intramembrane metalloprotease [Deltaproteobacteria bacterium]